MTVKFIVRGYLLLGAIAFLAHATGCASARLTQYRESFKCRPPEYPPGVRTSSSGECTYFGKVEYAGAEYHRYDLMDLYRWKRESPSMSYLIPVTTTDVRALVVPGLAPPFQTNENCRFIFVPEGIQNDPQAFLNYDGELKYHPDWHPLIVLVEATTSGKGTKVKLIERSTVQDGGLRRINRECEVIDVLHQNPWWVSTLPLAYVVTVPVDVVTFPIQAPFIYVGWRISKTMSPR